MTEIQYNKLINPSSLIELSELDSFCSTMLDEDDPMSHLHDLLTFLIICEELEEYEYCAIINKHIEFYML